MGDDGPIDPGELILRRIPGPPDYYNPSLPSPVLAFAFRPTPQGTDGTSGYTATSVSPGQPASASRRPASYYVIAKLLAADVLALGLTLLPTPGTVRCRAMSPFPR